MLHLLLCCVLYVTTSVSIFYCFSLHPFISSITVVSIHISGILNFCSDTSVWIICTRRTTADCLYSTIASGLTFWAVSCNISVAIRQHRLWEKANSTSVLGHFLMTLAKPGC